MRQWLTSIIGASALVFATFSSGNTYQLKSYSVGPGATNSAASNTYHLQGSVGEQTNSSTAGSTYTANNSSIQTEQINVPGAPTLSNNGGLYYNQLNCIVNTSNNPSDTTYSVAVSTTSGFTSTSYVQANGTLGASPVYQTYTVWGGASGFQIVGLLPNTTYWVKVDAMQGKFSNTKYGASSNLATAALSLSFSVSPNSSNFGSFCPSVVTTSANISFSFATNAASGGTIYVMGKNGGLTSSSKSYTINAVSGDLSSLSSGFGIQASNPSQTSGGPLSTVSPYNGTGNVVGAEGTQFAPMFTSPAEIVGGSGTANIKVKAASTAPNASDYNEVFTFDAAAGF